MLPQTAHVHGTFSSPERALERALRPRHRVPSQDGGDLRSRQHGAADPRERPPVRAARPPRRDRASRCSTWAAAPGRCCCATPRASARRRRRSQRGHARHRTSARARRGERPVHARRVRFLPATSRRIASAMRSSRAWAACTICRSRPSTSSSASCATGSLDNGQLLLAEPVDTDGREAPAAVARWNAKSVMAARAPLMPMEESHEAPIGADVLLRQPGALRLSPRDRPRARGKCSSARLPARAFDHLAMRYLHARYGNTGNVVAALWEAR